MAVGKVKWFDPMKGFEFIVGPDQQDIFVHFTAIQSGGFRRLREGEEVQYDLATGPKGLVANTVIRLNPPPESSQAP